MPRLIDPAIARAVARRVAGTSDESGSYLLDRLRRDLEVAVPRSESLVAEASGIPAPAPTGWHLIGRGEWAEVNINGMITLLKPLADRFGSRLSKAPFPVRYAQRAVVSVEVGALLGYVSRRVLGQYDLLVTEGPPGRKRRHDRSGGGALYFVGRNMVETEQRLGLIPEDFALWVAVHEVTHRFQFAGVPWLRPRFFGLVEEYLNSVELDARSFAKRLAEAGRRLARREIPADEKNPMYLMASTEQRRVLDEIQALMSVVEGHGNFVMDKVGAEVIPSFKRMRRMFQARREQQSAVQKAFGHVIGLEMKMRQYEVGQRFCESVWARGGASALGQLWVSHDQFPSLAELQEPERWLQRVA